MSINASTVNYEQVLETMREANREIEVIGIKTSLYAGCFKIIGEKAKVCHEALKTFNDKHFPEVTK